MTDEFWNSKEILQRYIDEGVIGKGGFGTVYKAMDIRLGKSVAIKVLNSNLSDVQLMRFQQEAKLSGKLRHENILSVLDFGVTETGQPYLVTEYLPGKTLAQLITAHGVIEIDQAVPLFIQICEGMRHSHDSGVLHRDLKPGNIILSDNQSKTQTPKIVDFGIARLKEQDSRLTATGIAIGSPLYMSPEQAAGSPVDERCDIYAFGCVMYETLTGSPPFNSETAIATALLHKNEMPEQMSARALKDFPEGIEKIVAKCLEKQPTLRYQSFQALLEDLDDLKDEVAPQSDSSLPNDASMGPPTHRTGLPSRLILVPAILLFAIISLVFMQQKNVTDSEPPPTKKAGGMDPFQMNDPLTLGEFENREWYTVVPSREGYINIRGVDATDTRLKELSKYKLIYSIDLSENELSGEGFKFLKNVRIWEVRMNNCPVTAQSLKQIAQIKELTLLYLNFAHELKDADVATLQLSPTLSFLSISGNQLSEETIKALNGIKKLNNLNLTKMKITAKGVAYLQGLPNLVSVSFFKRPLQHDTIVAFNKGRTIPHVSFLQMTLDEKNIDDIIRLRCTRLFLDEVTITHDAIMKLSGCKNLSKLRAICPGIASDEKLRLRRSLPADCEFDVNDAVTDQTPDDI